MKNNKIINVLFLSAEVTPIAKLGGLGDVAGALPKALSLLGVDIRLCLPFYGLIDRNKYKVKKIIGNIAVPFNNKVEKINLWKTTLPNTNIPIYLIEHRYFSGQKIYQTARSTSKNKYSRGMTDLQRFSFFTRASLQIAKTLNFPPDIVHANDWHIGLAADFIDTLKKHDCFFNNIKTLFTIHNLANQGLASPKIINLTGIDQNLITVKNDLKNHDLVMMVQGILASDLINTVSPTYAKEILTKEYGAGLSRVLALRKKQLFGILNGIDTDFFNPKIDKLIAKRFSQKTLQKKPDNKLTLQKKLGWPLNKKVALVGIVTRFVRQKGLSLITEKFLQSDCQFVFLGSGEKRYEEYLLKLAKKYPKKLNVQIKFDEKLAHEIYAGSDIFLVPSRFEPCGLTQMIAMRYASVPIVRATGGLKDTVNQTTGFTFNKFKPGELNKTLTKALNIFYQQPKIWRRLQLNGMKQDFSWNKSAKEYLKLYKKLLHKK